MKVIMKTHLIVISIGCVVVVGCSSGSDDGGVATDASTTDGDSIDTTPTDSANANAESGAPSDSEIPIDAVADGAHASDASDASSSETSDAKDCGGVVCPSTQFCNYAPSAKCGTASDAGTCMIPPSICGGVFAQVCGCNGVTYDNECSAHSASASVAHDGPCP
jgi:hypothetical protein